MTSLLDRLEAAGLADRARILNRDPWVVVVDDYLPASERQALMDAASPRLGAPMLDTGDIEQDQQVRTGRVAWIHHDHDARTRALADRVAGLVGIPLVNAESFQVVRYGPTQQYLAHYDGYDMTTRVGAANAERGGQRIATAIIYLAEPHAGGATGFPTLGLDVGAKPGRLLIFWNVAAADPTRPHPESLHAGNPVTRGEKWIANLWFRERPYKGL
jgi:prolyl 4-hydroxylase